MGAHPTQPRSQRLSAALDADSKVYVDREAAWTISTAIQYGPTWTHHTKQPEDLSESRKKGT